jgi:hypothetical protein
VVLVPPSTSILVRERHASREERIPSVRSRFTNYHEQPRSGQIRLAAPTVQRLSPHISQPVGRLITNSPVSASRRAVTVFSNFLTGVLALTTMQTARDEKPRSLSCRDLIASTNGFGTLAMLTHQNTSLVAARLKHEDCRLPVTGATENILCFHERGAK